LVSHLYNFDDLRNYRHEHDAGECHRQGGTAVRPTCECVGGGKVTNLIGMPIVFDSWSGRAYNCHAEYCSLMFLLKTTVSQIPNHLPHAQSSLELFKCHLNEIKALITYLFYQPTDPLLIQNHKCVFRFPKGTRNNSNKSHNN